MLTDRPQVYSGAEVFKSHDQQAELAQPAVWRGISPRCEFRLTNPYWINLTTS